MSRATGNTFRTMLLALHHASDGDHVVFLVSTHAYAYDCYKTALRMIKGYGITGLVVDSRSRIIKFPGDGGSLKFCAEGQDLRLFKFNRIYKDLFS